MRYGLFDLRKDCATGGTAGGVQVIRSGNVGSKEGGAGNAEVGFTGV